MSSDNLSTCRTSPASPIITLLHHTTASILCRKPYTTSYYTPRSAITRSKDPSLNKSQRL